MKCANCNRAELVPAVFVYVRAKSHDAKVHLEVNGFECPNCSDRVLTGRDAEQISRDWFALDSAKSDGDPSTGRLPGRRASKSHP